jgi:hypothetical protein
MVVFSCATTSGATHRSRVDVRKAVSSSSDHLLVEESVGLLLVVWFDISSGVDEEIPPDVE